MRTKRVANSLRVTGNVAGAGDCPTCGKMRYASKHDAKTAIRRLPSRDGKLRAYRCGPDGPWHIGHTPAALLRGDITRDQIPPKKRGPR